MAHGPYEMLTGRVHYEVNPYHPLNSIITDLDKAPRNAQGLVEFSTDVRILKPVDMQKSSQRLFYYIANRGGVADVFNELLVKPGEELDVSMRFVVESGGALIIKDPPSVKVICK
jgi:hypothetical protein